MKVRSMIKYEAKRKIHNVCKLIYTNAGQTLKYEMCCIQNYRLIEQYDIT